MFYHEGEASVTDSLLLSLSVSSDSVTSNHDSLLESCSSYIYILCLYICIQRLDKIIGTVQILLQYFDELFIMNSETNLIMGVYIHCK